MTIYRESKQEYTYSRDTSGFNDNIKFVVGRKKTNITDELNETTLDREDFDSEFSDDYQNASTLQRSYSVGINTENATILRSMLEDEYYETGIVNASEKFFVKWFDSEPTTAMNELSKLFLDNFSLQGSKVNILLGILHILSHMKYEQITPLGVVLAGYGTTHGNKEVAEYSLKCFEDWDNVEMIEKLEAMKFSSKWLQDYANDIIAELKEKES